MSISGLLFRLKFRWKWARLGVRFLRTKGFRLDHVSVHGKRIPLNFPDGERQVLEHELAQIYFEDCYRLDAVRPGPSRVLDIGGNVGMFSLVARHHFPAAVIHCYEPNPRLHGYLRGHVEPLGVVVHGEAVGDRAGTVAMSGESGSLYGTVVADTGGTVPMVAFDTAVERIGGPVGLLKLDCEGAEWGILENSKAIDTVGVLTMEYHLWARPGSTTRDVEALVTGRGLRVEFTSQKPGEEWGLMFARRA